MNDAAERKAKKGQKPTPDEVASIRVDALFEEAAKFCAAEMSRISMAEHIELNDWDEFENDLRERLQKRAFRRMILFRNFAAERLETVLTTGTDRDSCSGVWNADQFDHDHEANPVGKTPEEILYAHRVNTHTNPFTVLNVGEEYTTVQEDLTEQLQPHDAVSIYDSAYLDRSAFNEHWFNGDPRKALLYVYTVKEED